MNRKETQFVNNELIFSKLLSSISNQSVINSVTTATLYVDVVFLFYMLVASRRP